MLAHKPFSSSGCTPCPPCPSMVNKEAMPTLYCVYGPTFSLLAILLDPPRSFSSSRLPAMPSLPLEPLLYFFFLRSFSFFFCSALLASTACSTHVYPPLHPHPHNPSTHSPNTPTKQSVTIGPTGLVQCHRCYRGTLLCLSLLSLMLLAIIACATLA